MMKKPNLIILLTLMIFATAIKTRAQQNTIWMYCYVDANATMPQKDGEEKHEGRFYVTNLISMPVKQYKSINPSPTSTKYFEDACVDYFEQTVMKAAKSSGEQLEESGISGLDTNIDGPDVNSTSGYELGSKDEVEKDRAERIESNREPGRKILTFDWDPTRKSVSALQMKPDEHFSVMNRQIQIDKFGGNIFGWR